MFFDKIEFKLKL